MGLGRVEDLLDSLVFLFELFVPHFKSLPHSRNLNDSCLNRWIGGYSRGGDKTGYCPIMWVFGEWHLREFLGWVMSVFLMGGGWGILCGTGNPPAASKNHVIV